MPNGFECLHVIHSVRQLTTRLWPWAVHLWFRPDDSILLATAEESKCVLHVMARVIRAKRGTMLESFFFFFPCSVSDLCVCISVHEWARLCVCVCVCRCYKPDWDKNVFYVSGNEIKKHNNRDIDNPFFSVYEYRCVLGLDLSLSCWTYPFLFQDKIIPTSKSQGPRAALAFHF